MKLPAHPLLLLPSHCLTISLLLPIQKSCVALLLRNGGINLSKPEINFAAEMVKSWPEAVVVSEVIVSKLLEKPC